MSMSRKTAGIFGLGALAGAALAVLAIKVGQEAVAEFRGMYPFDEEDDFDDEGMCRNGYVMCRPAEAPEDPELAAAVPEPMHDGEDVDWDEVFRGADPDAFFGEQA